MRTVLLLDVDGVLSPFSKGLPDYFTDWVEPENFGYWAPLSRQMANRIASWGVEIVWLTTWGKLANELIVPIFGWDEKETLERTYMGDWLWWKLDSACSWLKNNQVDRLLWFDDDLAMEMGLVEEHLDIPEERRLLFTPNLLTGLTPDDLDTIEAWLKETETN